MKRNFGKTARVFLGILLAVGLITACAKKTEPPINLKNLDLSVNPADDFFQYANGGWMKMHPIPKDKSRYGTFDQLSDENEKRIKELVKKTAKKKHPQGTIAQKIADFYNLGMDTDKIEKEGISPLKEEFGRINRISSLSDLQNEIAHLHGTGIWPLFYLRGAPDPKNSNMVIAHLSQGGLGMPDRDYYLKIDPHSKKIREEYVKFATKIFQLMGEDTVKAAASAQIIMKLETQLAKASMSRLERRDPNKTYHKMSLKKLQRLSKGINWKVYFTDLGLPDPGDINVAQPEFFKEIGQMFKTVPLDNWRIYLSWNLIRNAADYLSSPFVNASFEFYGKVLSGREAERPRWKRVISATNRAMSQALGQLYVEKYFPPEAKARMLKLVMNLKKAFAERIQNLTWMSDVTKKKALAKLEAMNVKIGYPDKWRDYSKLEIKRDSYVLNALRASKFNTKYNLNKIGKPVDRTEWLMPPQMVNAYYNPAMNEICFPAGILQPPFFFMHGDDAVNYGAIGVVIGHEMTHGFDDQGRKFDKDGNLKNWWTKDDAKKFKERAEVLAKEFDSFVVLDTVHANGKLTLGENIADLGGLNIAFTAFEKTLEGKPTSPKIDGFTPEQRFFLAYAHVWAQNIRDKEILRRTKEDVHSLGRFRVNGPLPNIAGFLKAFNVKPGDRMYLPEDKRAIIW